MKRSLLLCMLLISVIVHAQAQPPQIESWYETDVRVVEGLREVFEITVSGAEPLSYQWYKDGVAISGATSNKLILENISFGDAGLYTLSISNPEGSITSDPINLEVSENNPPTARIHDPSPGQTFTPGEEFHFYGAGWDPDPWSAASHTWRVDYHNNGVVSPGPPIANQEWQSEGSSAGYFYVPEPQDIDLTPTSFFRIFLITKDYQGLTAKDSVDVSWSGQYYLPEPYIVVEPQSVLVSEGSPVEFSVTAKSVSGYQWKFNGTDIPGATNSTYSIPEAQESNAGTYSVVVSNPNASIESFGVELTLLSNLPPSITKQPQSLTITVGQDAEFRVSATRAQTYQWRFNGEDIDGANAASLYIDLADFDDAGIYSVVVSNENGSVESNEVELTIRENTAPLAFIVNPVAGTTYFPGKTISFEGFFTDPDQEGSRALAWSVEILRNGQTLPGPIPLTQGYNIYSYGYFVVPSEGLQPNDTLRLRFTVTDDHGLTGTTSVDLVRQMTGTVVLKTNPPNLFALVDGVQVKTRYAAEDSIGSIKTIAPMTPQNVNGVSYAFSNWGHGGSPSQSVTTQAVPTYYTINYSSPLVGAWRTTDVGSVNVPGTAFHSNGTYTLSGSGNDIWHTADAFRFVYQSVTGDVDIKARVTNLTNTHPWAKAGVMIRNSTDRSAKNVMTAITPASGATFQRRTNAGDVSVATSAPAATPYWVRLVRSGNTFTSYISSDGTNWVPLGSPETVTMNSRVYVGLVITSHSSNALATATFTDVSVSSPASAASVENDITIVEQGDDEFGVFPNPVSGNTLNVKLPANLTAGQLEIINTIGQMMSEPVTLEKGQTSVEVDVRTFRQGVYIIKYRDLQKVRTKAFIRK